MITLKDFMEVVNYRITEGSDYTWRCYGSNAYSLDYWNGDNDKGHSVGIVFDTKTQIVYEMSVSDYLNNRAYRLINPEYHQGYLDECNQRSAEYDMAWDDVKYIDLEVDQDMLDKVSAIVNGREYSTDISIPLDLDHDTLFELMCQAHEKNITLNQHVINILLEYANNVMNGAAKV